jgi:hypothetical protein
VSSYYIYSNPHLKELKYVMGVAAQETLDSFSSSDDQSSAAYTSDEDNSNSNIQVDIYQNGQSDTNVDVQTQVEPKKVVYQQPAAPARDCYKYTVPHLDGSSSTLCYSQSDYNQLVSLGYNYSSAKTFYDFHLDGVQDYQAQYEQTGSSIYLDAKASQQREADQEKQKMDSAIGSMQQIESRGY